MLSVLNRKNIFLKFCIIFFYLFTFVISNLNELGLKNIFEREKEILLSKSQEIEFSYVVEEEIKKYYQNVLEIYISLIDTDLVNSVLLPEYNNVTNYLPDNKNNSYSIKPNSFRDSYYKSYNSFLGNTNSFFVNRDIFASTAYYKFNTSTVEYFNKSEIVVEISEDFLNDEIYVKYFYIRNIFTPNWESDNNCNIKDKAWLKFYDLNLVVELSNNITYTKCKEELNSLIKNNPLLFIKLNSDSLKTSLYKHTKEEFSSNKIIKNKIERKMLINKIIQAEILNRKDSKVNLKNYLIEKQINQIKGGILEVIKLLIFLDNYGANLDQKKFGEKIHRLKSKIEDYIKLMDGFNIGVETRVDSIYYLLITFIILILIYFSYKTIREIKESYEKKII